MSRKPLSNAWNSLVSFFQGIPAWWSGLWQSVGDFFSNIWTNMMNNPVLTADCPDHLSNNNQDRAERRSH